MKALDKRVRRFAVTLGEQSPHSAALKVQYEASELASVTNPGPDRTPDACLREAADVLITLLGYLYRSGVTWKQLVRAAHHKMQENESRTWHLKNDGTYQHDSK